MYVLPVFNLTLHYNSGAAFSFLSDAGGWQRWFFIVVSLGVSLALMVWMALIKNQQKLLTFSLCMILAGAVGNLVDRVALGYVVDFISLHWSNYYFPAFNWADTCITVGAASMRLSSPIPAQLSPAATIAAVLSAEAMVTLVGIFATRS